jgi:hypothetical protein
MDFLFLPFFLKNLLIFLILDDKFGCFCIIKICTGVDGHCGIRHAGRSGARWIDLPCYGYHRLKQQQGSGRLNAETSWQNGDAG